AAKRSAFRPVSTWSKIPGSLGRPAPQDFSGEMVLYTEDWTEAGEDVELGGIQCPAADESHPRHTLRHRLVQAQHVLGRRPDRRSAGGSRRGSADALPPGSFL